MPGVDRLSLDLLLPVAEECVKLGIPVLALFPHRRRAQDARRQGSPEPRRPDPRVVRALKKEFPAWA
jgi:porphobilinogen synthase